MPCSESQARAVLIVSQLVMPYIRIKAFPSVTGKPQGSRVANEGGRTGARCFRADAPAGKPQVYAFSHALRRGRLPKQSARTYKSRLNGIHRRFRNRNVLPTRS